MMHSFEELTTELRVRGYDDQFVSEDNRLRALAANRVFDPDDVIVEGHWHRGDDDLFALLALFAVNSHRTIIRGIYQHDRENPEEESLVIRLRDKAVMDSLDDVDGQKIAELEQSFQDCNEKLREVVLLYEGEKNQHAASIARLKREGERQLEDWKNQFLSSFLEVLDDLDRALEASEEAHHVDPAIHKGLQLVANRFHAKLGEHDVYRLDKGSRFDPRLHEAIATVVVAHPELDGNVVDEVRAGYMRGDRVLRPARVTVGKFSPVAA